MASIQKRVDSAITKQADNNFRDHLGASIIGRACDREIWMSFRWVTKTTHEARMLRLFQRGHDEEPRLVKLLRAAGITVWQTDEATGHQFRILGHAGHYGGSMDGVGYGADEYPDTYFLLEFKTAGDKAFKQMQEKGVALAKPEHYAQMQQYMSAIITGNLSLEVALYIMINKNDDDIYYEWVPRNDKVAQHFYTRAGGIIASESPPLRINDSPSWYQCKFCDHFKVCQTGESAPEVNCRTCAHSTPKIVSPLKPEPGKGGVWFCEYHKQQLTAKDQRAGCVSHQYHPDLLERAVTYLGGADYEIDGQKITNAAPHVTSKKLKRLIEQ